MKRYFIGTLLGLLFCFWAQAQEVNVNAQLEPAEILIGDEVMLTIQLSYPPNLKLDKIELGVLEGLDSIEIKNIAKADTASRAPVVNVQQQILLTSFDEGVYEIPPIPVTFSRQGTIEQTQTQSLQLRVKTIPINPTDSVALQPIKDIIKEPLKLQDFLPYIGLGLGLIAIGFLVWFFVNRKKFKEEIVAPPPPELAPHELAMQRISALREARLLEQNEFKAFQTQISYILREYLEKRFQIVALEVTTFELSKKLATIDLPKGWTDSLKKLLQGADMVKFAKAEYPIDFHQKSLEQLIQFVEESKVVPKPEEEEAPEAEQED